MELLMKQNILKLIALLLMLTGVISCKKEPLDEALKQRKDKIFLKFISEADKEQKLAIVRSVNSLKLTSDFDLSEQHPFNFAVLKSKNGNYIPSATIEYFEKKAEIVSVTYLYQYKGGVFQGLTDEFSVMLKQTTSYAQLQELAEKNNCKVGEENQYEKNVFMLYVSKTSKLDAMQTANLFYETGLFVFSEPNFIILNAFR